MAVSRKNVTLRQKTIKIIKSMIGILQVASYIYKRYMDDFGVRIDEMKLHKLLYFTQRECLIQKGEPMFEAQFEAW